MTDEDRMVDHSVPRKDARSLGWRKEPISKILATVIDFRGRTPRKLGMTWGGGEIPALSANNVSMGRIDFSKECYLASDALYKRWMTKGHAERGDLVITLEAPLGNIAQVPDDRRYVLSQRVILLRFKKSEVDHSFMYHQMMSPRFQDLLRAWSTGTTAAGIRRASFVKVPVILPPLNEQQRIAEILNSVDESIQTTNRLIAKLTITGQSLRDSLLIGGIGRWPSSSISDLLTHGAGLIQTGPFGSQLHAYEYVAEGVPVVMPQDLINGVIDTTAIVRIRYEKAESLRRHKLSLNDLVFARRGDLSKCAVIEAEQVGWLCGTGCLLVKPGSGVNSDWLAEIYRHDSSQRQVAGMAVGSTMANLNTKIIARLVVPVPPLHEQHDIATTLRAHDRTIIAAARELSKLKEMKHGIMDDLLTGREV